MTTRFNQSPWGERNMTLIENIAMQRYITTNEKYGTKTYKFSCDRDIYIKQPLKKKSFFFQTYMI